MFYWANVTWKICRLSWRSKNFKSAVQCPSHGATSPPSVKLVQCCWLGTKGNPKTPPPHRLQMRRRTAVTFNFIKKMQKGEKKKKKEFQENMQGGFLKSGSTHLVIEWKLDAFEFFLMAARRRKTQAIGNVVTCSPWLPAHQVQGHTPSVCYEHLQHPALDVHQCWMNIAPRDVILV